MGEDDRELQNSNVILIGYRCTGKTSIGKVLAESLSLPFIDTDALVEKAIGTTIREMIEDRGWDFFRQQEKEAIGNLTGTGKSVIATGGGAVLDKDNAAFLKKHGFLIWLAADAKTIRERMLADPATVAQRPRFSREDLAVEVRSTLATREPVYRCLADLTIDTTAMAVEACADRIKAFLKQKYE